MRYKLNKLFYCSLTQDGLILAPPQKGYICISEGIDEYLEFIEIFRESKTSNEAYQELNQSFYASEDEFNELIEFSLKNNILKPIIENNSVNLDEFDREKYSRQINTFDAMPHIDEQQSLNIQQKLINSKVAIVGVGGIGSYLSLSLAMIGVGELILVDKDAVELSNTSRQILYDELDIGRIKIDVAAEKLKRHNQKLKLHTVNRFITEPKDLDFLYEHDDIDFLVLCADSPRNEIQDIIDSVTSDLKIPWILFGPFDQTKIILGPMIIPGETKSYREMLPPSEFIKDDRVQRINSFMTSAIIDPFNGLAAKMASVEILKYLTGYAEVSTKNRCLIINTDNWEIEVNEL